MGYLAFDSTGQTSIGMFGNVSFGYNCGPASRLEELVSPRDVLGGMKC